MLKFLQVSENFMKPFIIIAIAVGCSVIAVLGILFGLDAYNQMVYENEVQKYDAFIDDANTLTISYKKDVENCAYRYVEWQDFSCISKLDQKYRDDFSNLLFRYGYEQSAQELYDIWSTDLEYWYELEKLQIESEKTPDYMKSDIQKYWDMQKFSKQMKLQALKALSEESDSNP